MKLDYELARPEEQERFKEWLTSTTTEDLIAAALEPGATRSAVFLAVNRAYEAGLPERELASCFGKAVARSGISEADEGPVFDLFEALATVASRVHSRDPSKR